MEAETTASVRLFEERVAEVVRTAGELPLGREARHARRAVVVELHDAVGIEVGQVGGAVALGGGDDLDSPATDGEGSTDFVFNDGVVIHNDYDYAQVLEKCENYFNYFYDWHLSFSSVGLCGKKPPLSGACALFLLLLPSGAFGLGLDLLGGEGDRGATPDLADGEEDLSEGNFVFHNIDDYDKVWENCENYFKNLLRMPDLASERCVACACLLGRMRQ